MAVARYGDVSFWHDRLRASSLVPRAPLPGDQDVDVAIVGGGFTGLWTAYYLLAADPSIRVAVLERDIAGFGASGRNGGWCLGELAVPVPRLARAVGREGAVAMARTMHATVDEVGAVAAREDIDCDYAKGGSITYAVNRPQFDRLRGRAQGLRRCGFGDDDYRLLTVRDTARIVNAAGLHGGLFTPHVAVLQPAALARGLAEAVERAGGTVYEHTPVTAVEGSVVTTSRGRVRAGVAVRATEGYTPSLRNHERTLVPIENYMVVTEPLSADAWDEIGLSGRETFSDARHVIYYGQRTADDRIAFGGMSIPYRYRGRVDHARFARARVHERLRRTLTSLFPVLEDVAITHRWGGVLAAPRDWFPSVGYDRRAGAAWAGGYVGEGVGAANLAGRTLADLIRGEDTALVHLPWVNHRSPDWEPEPWRWLGFRSAAATLAVVDRAEQFTGRHQPWADVLLRRVLS